MRATIKDVFNQEKDLMGISVKGGLLVVSAMMAGIAFVSSGTLDAAMMGQEAVKARKEAMKSFSADMKEIQAFVKGGKGTTATVADKAREIAATAKQLPDLFPKGTGRGDLSDKETRALPKIWSDWPGFENASTMLVVEAGKLAEFAKAGDQGLIADQFATLGKVGCGGCHKAYRGAKAK